jgi:hypothetical protein
LILVENQFAMPLEVPDLSIGGFSDSGFKP